jgi:hypothetical protein
MSWGLRKVVPGHRDHPTHRKIIEECVAPIVAERRAVQYTL